MRQHTCQFQQTLVQWLRPACDIGKRGSHDCIAEQPDQHALPACGQVIDCGCAQAGGKDSVCSGRDTAADDVAKRRNAQFEADRIPMFGEVPHHRLRTVLRAFGNYDSAWVLPRS